MSDPVDSDREDDGEPEWDPSVHRLPVWATIGQALQAIAKEWRALLKAVAVPALGIASVSVFFQRNPEYVEAVLPNSSSFLQDMLQIIPETVVPASVGVLIAISCHRLVILGVDSLPSALGLFWSGRETRFLGRAFGIVGIALIVLLPLTFLEMSLYNLLGFSPLPPVVLGIPIADYIGIPIAGYICARLSLVFPATAISQRPTFADSWRLSRSNGWRLALVMALPYLVLIPLSASLQPGGIALQFLAAFILVLLGLIQIASLSKAFCWFTAEIEPSGVALISLGEWIRKGAPMGVLPWIRSLGLHNSDRGAGE